MIKTAMTSKTPTLLAFLTLTSLAITPLAAAEDDIPRLANGKPDLSGNYDIASLTPFERNPSYGDKQFMTREEAEKIEKMAAAGMAIANKASDPDREAPPAGGDGSAGASGAVGGYNAFWVDPGTQTFAIDGKFRTSILYEPPNGRMPELSEDGKARRAKARPYTFKNTGTAWWLDQDGGEGPYDGPESLATIERCLYLTVASVPARPVLYNNLKTIVQTDTHVSILVEWMHETRVVRLDSEHAPDDLRSMSGDSIGWWEGDTLVVETTDFLMKPSEDRELKVVERFSPAEGGLLYDFTVYDEDYVAPYSGQFLWPRTEDKLYEYACHEGNYAMGNILRGARLLEQETRAKQAEAGSRD